MQIRYEVEHGCSAAYDKENRVGIAEFEDADGRWVITHTEVDPAYGGQGIARRLIEENLRRFYDIDCRITETRIGDTVHRGLLTLL